MHFTEAPDNAVIMPLRCKDVSRGRLMDEKTVTPPQSYSIRPGGTWPAKCDPGCACRLPRASWFALPETLYEGVETACFLRCPVSATPQPKGRAVPVY